MSGLSNWISCSIFPIKNTVWINKRHMTSPVCYIISLWHHQFMTSSAYDIISLWHHQLMTSSVYDIISLWHHQLKTSSAYDTISVRRYSCMTSSINDTVMINLRHFTLTTTAFCVTPQISPFIAIFMNPLRPHDIDHEFLISQYSSPFSDVP